MFVTLKQDFSVINLPTTVFFFSAANDTFWNMEITVSESAIMHVDIFYVEHIDI